MKANEKICSEGAWHSEITCGHNNYLYLKQNFWTINRTQGDTEHVWAVENGRMESKLTTNEELEFYPVVYLKANLVLNGHGTTLDPYYIAG